MLRWSWRLFRREWRQQFLILLLMVVAVAATVVGSAVAVNTPPPANAGFGTAHDLATFNLTPTAKAGNNSPAYVAAQTALLEHRFGRVQIIDNQTFSVPGSTQTYQLRSQDPHGPYGGPMLQLLSGHYPTGSNQIALTPKLASELNLSVGDAWPLGGKTVVGIVQNPQSLLDEFALVAPGQVTHPTQVNVLFDASPSAAKSLPTYVTTPGANTNGINPETIVLALATVGMLLIALVSIGGFTVLAQRRMRSLGMVSPWRRPTATSGSSWRPTAHRRARRRRRGLRPGPGLWLAPTAQRAERASCDRRVRTALGRDRAGHGAGGRRHVLRRRLPGRAITACRSSVRSPGGPHHPARSTAR